MAKKIKHTKNELKAQRDALQRFERYLPTLQLKKQQLQIELRQLDAAMEEKEAEENRVREQLAAWISLFSEPIDFDEYVKLQAVKRSTGNIAGVDIPVLDDVAFEEITPDLSATPAWIDDGIRVLQDLLRLRLERQVLEEQHRLLSDELRTTTQRVNLFEKVKIPESRENIRTIRIFLGDEQTAGVARAKIAKGKTERKAKAA